MDMDLRASERLALGAGAVHAAVALVFWHGRRQRPAWGRTLACARAARADATAGAWTLVPALIAYPAMVGGLESFNRMVSHDLRGPLPPARADGRLLRHVFVKLLADALKFSARSAAAAVRVHGDSANSQVVVEVRDNGVGFPPERAARLFQPFMRLHGSQFEGPGVGPTIVRRIVGRHGGRVWAEGRPGQGASFHFSLPAA